MPSVPNENPAPSGLIGAGGVPTAYDPNWQKYTNLTREQIAWFQNQPEGLIDYATKMRAWHDCQQLLHPSGIKVQPTLNQPWVQFWPPQGSNAYQINKADMAAAYDAYVARGAALDSALAQITNTINERSTNVPAGNGGTTPISNRVDIDAILTAAIK